MEGRNIHNGQYGWFEKGAMKKIEQLSVRQQASCKLVYIALCSLSAKQKDSKEIDGWKVQIASFASVSGKTVQRCLPLLKSLGIIDYTPQDRKSNGTYERIRIWLTDNTLAVGHLQKQPLDTSEKVRSPTSVLLDKEYKENTIPYGITATPFVLPENAQKVNNCKAWLLTETKLAAFTENEKNTRRWVWKVIQLKEKYGGEEFDRKWKKFKGMDYFDKIKSVETLYNHFKTIL
jgi:hypothetical protein